jgi:putative spermidine/putrescine transport system ATP-binding protein
VRGEGGLARVDIDGGAIRGTLRGAPKGERAVAAIRPDDLVPVRAGQSGIAAVVEAIEYRGREFHGLARTAAGAELHFSSPSAIAVGATVSLAADPGQVLIFDAEDA